MASTSTERDDMPEEPETYDATEIDENKWGALRMIGLLALVAAFAGFVYLAYMQGVRNGAVGAPPPVITAEGGPYKVAPQNPGGQSFANQDKMIFDRVEGSSANEEKTASSAPASSASGDDMVSHKSAPLVVADSSPTATKPLPITPTPATAPAAAASAPAPAQDHADGIAAAIEKADTQVPQSAATNDLTPKVAPPVAKAEPVETPKPTTMTPPAETKVATAEPPPTAKAAPPSAPAAAGAAGAYAVQIASYKDMPAAQDAWKKFSAKFGDAIGAHGPDYQTADVPGKGTYYRLRVAGFDSKESAGAFCSQLKAKSQGCIVVRG